MLHILSKTPLDLVILERMTTGDMIILIEDAVIEALINGPCHLHWQHQQQHQKIFVLAADLDIRGLKSDRIVKGIEIIDYQGFVQLTINNEVIHSWH
jgi:tRNA 2-thiouridine synthesizing protein B